MCFFKKKQPAFDKDAIAQMIKERVVSLEYVVKSLTLSSQGEEGELADKKRSAAEWGKKCVAELLECAQTLSMMLPPRKGKNADVHQRRILQTLDEMGKELLDSGVYYAFLETRVYPLVKTLSEQIETCLNV